MCWIILVLYAGLLATTSVFASSVDQSSLDATDYVYINKSCLAFFAKKIEMKVFESPFSNYSIHPSSSNANCGQSDKASLSFTANVKSKSVSDVTLTLDFLASNRGYWTLDKASAMLNGKPHVLLMRWPDSPNSMGFKCSNTGSIVAAESDPRVEFTFHRLQVQPFGITNGVFTEANDCVGFMTTEIFSSLFVLFLLIGVFTYGLVMLMSIQTNDTFDDPKRKIIQLGGATE